MCTNALDDASLARGDGLGFSETAFAILFHAGYVITNAVSQHCGDEGPRAVRACMLLHLRFNMSDNM